MLMKVRCFFMRECFKVHISAVDDFFHQWDPRSATLIEEVCEPQVGGYVEK